MDFTLGPWDYVIIVVIMLISVSIGLFFRFTGSRQKSTDDFLMAGRNMTRFPVVFSLVATKLSGVLLIGEPADTFLFGTQRCVALVFVFVGSLVAAYVFLPVFYAVQAQTIYVYLEMRFGKQTRHFISIVCFIQMLLYLPVTLYAPALALDATTKLDLNTCFILMGVVSTSFSALGGMKAVMWADVFQLLCMFSCLLAVLAFSIQEAGGLGNVYGIAYEAGRLEFFNFDFDPTVRYTFWSSLAFGLQFGVMSICVNQSEMQRAFAIKKLENAQSAFLWSSVPSFLISVLTNTIGLVMFVIFRNCNPLSEKSGIGLGKGDQIVPYYIVSRMAGYPGLSGLCVGGILCGSISTMSSAVNAMSTVVIDDFLKPNVSEKTASKINFTFLAKLLVVGIGFVITCLPFLISFIKGVYEITTVLNATILAPVFSIYLLGMLTSTANQEGIFIGLACGFALTSWISVGSKMFGAPNRPTSLSTVGCPNSNLTSAFTFNETITYPSRNYTMGGFEKVSSPSTTFPLYNLSYLWIGFIGITTTLITGYLASFIISRFKKSSSVDPILLSPVSRLWIEHKDKIREQSLKQKTHDEKVQTEVTEESSL
ncbi:hypothetical protein JTE90_003614 [Oedothorax gibbosus]|uniref:Sodium-dependent multivitamin transporter n=1 Tax=Oedothorax gibbosus TaxID=931172 RepID=A0AAV6VEE3_9ARAC|nr:hypothetical protein JTE90_003614 [Oedothorax gibbosus]